MQKRRTDCQLACCLHNVMKDSAHVFCFTLSNHYQLCYLGRSSRFVFLFQEQQHQEGFATCCCMFAWTDFAGGWVTLQTAPLQISRDEVLQKYHRARVSRESACILKSSSMLLTLHPISVLISYLSSCSPWCNKDLDIPYPFSRDYEYLEDYLQRQMKECVCGHASKRLLKDKCENWIRPYWETGYLTSREVPFRLLCMGFRLCTLKGSSLNTVIVLSLFWEFLVKYPKT